MLDVLVSIKGFQNINDDSDCIEMIAVGKYQKTSNGAVVVYRETDTAGEEIRVILKYDITGKLVIERSGALNSTMIIERGRRNQNFYNTLNGNFLMGIYGESMFCELGANEGLICAEYQIDVEGAIISKNKIEITLKEV